MARRALAPLGDPLVQTATGSLYRFAEEIRRVVPPVDGYFDPTARPAYGILTPPNVGHLVHWVAHAATPSDNFGPYSGSRHFELARRFFEMRDEASAFAVARELGARYVLTVEYGPAGALGLTQRLHREDGIEREDAPAWQRFRLVTEGPRGGRSLAEIYGGSSPPGVVPFKLFEVVEGAVLEVRTAPGAEVRASTVIRTPIGRSFEYALVRRADASGVVRIRVPYATDGVGPSTTEWPWQVQSGDTILDVHVSESAVRDGGVVRVDFPGAAG
jgi:hypothetical protein